MPDLPPCGVYRTTRPLADSIPSGRLVYFHNHGEPGPGVYLPEDWAQNRARWHKQGTPIPAPEWAASLSPLAPEGLYRVREGFDCCDKHCRTFGPEMLVQLGYNAAGEAILFVPEWTPAGLAFPAQGSLLDPDRVSRLAPLLVAQSAAPGGPLH
ncbi:MAG: hypothetical protein ACYC8T_05515 [Myxococcaceae bacterium]